MRFVPLLIEAAELKDACPVGIYMFKVNKRNTRTRCEICSKFDAIGVVLVSLLLTLNSEYRHIVANVIWLIHNCMYYTTTLHTPLMFTSLIRWISILNGDSLLIVLNFGIFMLKFSIHFMYWFLIYLDIAFLIFLYYLRYKSQQIVYLH